MFVLYLIYTELFTIGAICVDCTSVHIITFLLFCLLIFNASLGSPGAVTGSGTAASARGAGSSTGRERKARRSR